MKQISSSRKMQWYKNNKLARMTTMMMNLAMLPLLQHNNIKIINKIHSNNVVSGRLIIINTVLETNHHRRRTITTSHLNKLHLWRSQIDPLWVSSWPMRRIVANLTLLVQMLFSLKINHPTITKNTKTVKMKMDNNTQTMVIIITERTPMRLRNLRLAHIFSNSSRQMEPINRSLMR